MSIRNSIRYSKSSPPSVVRKRFFLPVGLAAAGGEEAGRKARATAGGEEAGA